MLFSFITSNTSESRGFRPSPNSIVEPPSTMWSQTEYLIFPEIRCSSRSTNFRSSLWSFFLFSTIQKPRD